MIEPPSQDDAPVVLALIANYLPGYMAGGSIRSLSALVERLEGEYRFRVVTRDRDLGTAEKYPDIVPDVWHRGGKTDIFYLSPGNCSFRTIRRVLSTTKHDLLYLNSFFSPSFTIKPMLLRRLHLIPRVPIILAPRGEFSSGALSIKSFKKRVYIFLSRIVKLGRHVVWHASSEYEAKDIRQWIGKGVKVLVAPDLAAGSLDRSDPVQRRKKVAGSLKIVFLSRISRMKNLEFVFRRLRCLKGDVSLNVFGPMEDLVYWEQCRKIVRELPSNIRVEYEGPVPHERVPDIFRSHDLFFFPTLGENFGHVILEALFAGCPVLISDRTPWLGLEKNKAGWDLPLEQPGKFVDVLEKAIGMDADSWKQFSQGAQDLGRQFVTDASAVEKNRDLFRIAFSLKT